jgi:hypothetical protein
VIYRELYNEEPPSNLVYLIEKWPDIVSGGVSIEREGGGIYREQYNEEPPSNLVYQSQHLWLLLRNRGKYNLENIRGGYHGYKWWCTS